MNEEIKPESPTDSPSGLPPAPCSPLEGMAGLHATLKDVVRKIMSSTSLECIAANVRGGGTTTYTVTISPAKSGDVFISMDCEVTPVKRTLLVVKGLDNGKAPKPRTTKDSAIEADAERIHGGAGAGKQSEALPPLDGATC